MNDVRHPTHDGQASSHPAPAAKLDLSDPAARAAWAAEARGLIQALRLYAFDGVAPHDERQYARQHLRRVMRSRFRALEALVNAMDPSAPRSNGAHAPTTC